jgi:hypothetical protein
MAMFLAILSRIEWTRLHELKTWCIQPCPNFPLLPDHSIFVRLIVPKMTNPVPGGFAGSSAEYVGEDFVPDDIPEMLKDDALVAYSRCRFADREGFMKNLEDEHGKVRLRAEIKRIENLRNEYEMRKDDHVEVLEYRRRLWRQHAKNKSAENLKSLSEKLDQMKKLPKSPRSETTDPDSYRRLREIHEKRILEKVGKWEVHDPKMPPYLKDLMTATGAESKRRLSIFSSRKNDITGPLSNSRRSQGPAVVATNESDSENDNYASYGMHVRRITMKNSSNVMSPSYKIDTLDSYPLEDILGKDAKEDNPLTTECDPNTIRYFHFPANNMRWVEVCFPFLEIAIVILTRSRRQSHDIMAKSEENIIIESTLSTVKGPQIY